MTTPQPRTLDRYRPACAAGRAALLATAVTALCAPALAQPPGATTLGPQTQPATRTDSPSGRLTPGILATAPQAQAGTTTTYSSGTTTTFGSDPLQAAEHSPAGQPATSDDQPEGQYHAVSVKEPVPERAQPAAKAATAPARTQTDARPRSLSEQLRRWWHGRHGTPAVKESPGQ